MAQPSLHENISPTNDYTSGSDRSFGIAFAVVFGVIALFPLWNGENIKIWALFIMGLFLISSFIYPKIFSPFNRIWFQFSLLLYKIVNPLIMGLIFFGVVTPTGLLMRQFSKNPLDLSFNAAEQSYWKHRTPPSPEPGSMKRQF